MREIEITGEGGKEKEKERIEREERERGKDTEREIEGDRERERQKLDPYFHNTNFLKNSVGLNFKCQGIIFSLHESSHFFL